MRGGNGLCRCLRIDSHCVFDSLVLFQSELQTFKSTKRFDIFYSAPWSAGNHMTRMLASTSALGANTWHRGSFVGTVLYMYQCLILLKILEPTSFPILEYICNTFEDTVFRGQRPRFNLCSCYNLWLGSKLSFPKKRNSGHYDMHDHGKSDNIHSGRKWTLRAVDDDSRGAEDFKRSFSPAKVSLFSLLVDRKFVIDDDVLAWLYCNKALGKVCVSFFNRQVFSPNFVF